MGFAIHEKRRKLTSAAKTEHDDENTHTKDETTASPPAFSPPYCSKMTEKRVSVHAPRMNYTTVGS